MSDSHSSSVSPLPVLPFFCLLRVPVCLFCVVYSSMR
jgi:hypothetical protein